MRELSPTGGSEGYELAARGPCKAGTPCGERRSSGMRELSPTGGSEGYGACGKGPPQDGSALWGEEEQRNERAFADRRKRGIWSLRRRGDAAEMAIIQLV